MNPIYRSNYVKYEKPMKIWMNLMDLAVKSNVTEGHQRCKTTLANINKIIKAYAREKKIHKHLKEYCKKWEKIAEIRHLSFMLDSNWNDCITIIGNDINNRKPSPVIISYMQFFCSHLPLCCMALVLFSGNINTSFSHKILDMAYCTYCSMPWPELSFSA